MCAKEASKKSTAPTTTQTAERDAAHVSMGAVAFSPRGDLLATGSSDGIVRLWDVDQENGTLRIRAELLGHTSRVRSMRFSPDGESLVTGSEDHSARLWDARTGSCRQVLAHQGIVVTASFSPDNTRVITASWDGFARVWEAASGAVLATLTGHTDALMSASFSPDGARVVTGSDDGTARVWDPDDGRTLLTLEGHADCVRAAEFSPNGKRIVTASFDGTAQVWDAKSGKVVAKLVGHQGEVESAEFSPDGTHVVTASWDHSARVWETKTGMCVAELSARKGVLLEAHFSPDGERVLTAGDGTVRIWSVDRKECLWEPGAVSGSIKAFALAPSGKLLVTGVDQGDADIWSQVESEGSRETWRATGKVDHRPLSDADRKRVTDLLATLPPHRWNRTVRIHERSAVVTEQPGGRRLVCLLGVSQSYAIATLSPDQNLLLTAYEDGWVGQVRSANSGEVRRQLVGHKAAIVEAEFRDNGRSIVTVDQEGTALKWSAYTARLLGRGRRPEGSRLADVSLEPVNEQPKTPAPLSEDLPPVLPPPGAPPITVEISFSGDEFEIDREVTFADGTTGSEVTEVPHVSQLVWHSHQSLVQESDPEPVSVVADGRRDFRPLQRLLSDPRFVLNPNPEEDGEGEVWIAAHHPANGVFGPLEDYDVELGDHNGGYPTYFNADGESIDEDEVDEAEGSGDLDVEISRIWVDSCTVRQEGEADRKFKSMRELAAALRKLGYPY